jgi:YVTN family beta-propeller protein
MFPRTPLQTTLLRASVLAALLIPCALWFLIQPPNSHAQSTSVLNFESPQVHPLALTPDGTRLLAVNSPNGTLSVFNLSSGQAPKLIAEIPVGLEPVSVALRNNNEAWVANWLSDSISIVDLATANVVKTIEVGDEPTDIIFAGSAREMAFVCVSGGASLLSGISVDQLGHGQVKVFDPNNLTASPVTIDILAKQPRALARNADGSRVFISVFESGNQTTVVKESDVTANGGLPAPNPPIAAGLPPAPHTGLIVKRVGTQWVDELGRSWNASIPYTLADNDVYVINSNTSSLPSTVATTVTGVGTHIGNMAFDPVQSRLLVANLDDINQVRFEPNVSGKFQNNRITILTNAGNGTPVVSATPDLNQHVNFGNAAGSESERAQSLAMPADLVRKSDGTYFIAATSSARVGVLASDGTVTDRIAVGQGPTGLALDESRQSLYVLNRFDQTISVVDTTSKSQINQVPIGLNPESQATRAGRHFLYDASLSAHGTVSCASCHLNGHRDGMVWDLGNPQGSLDPVSVFFPPNITGTDNQHPMKGPMMTQSLRGIIGNEPFHWRGDRAGLESFNPAFMSLLGGPGQLTAPEMADFKAFILGMKYPPNPNEVQNRPLNEASAGFIFFSTELLDGGHPSGVNCSACHLVTNFQNGSDNKITPSIALQEPQSIKVPQFRGLYQKLGIHRTQTSPQITGFGLIHDGTFDTLFNFMKAPQFKFDTDPLTADSWRRDIEQMIIRLDTGTPPVVGLMITLDASNKASGATNTRLNLLMNQTNLNNCDLVVHGLYGGTPRSFLFSGGTFLPDSLTEAPATISTLLSAAGSRGELTFMAVPKGEGRLRSIDVDNNGVLNDDEPRTTVQLRGRVLNSTGVGVAGVTITLSGSQSANATTDVNGNVVFNLVSMSGSATLTPSQGANSFGPASQTFTSPTTNQIAIFTTPAGATFTTPLGVSNNVIDSSATFVSQHYQDFLARDPDAAGLAFWQNEINSCGNNQTCVELKRINVSAAFYLSIEFQETGSIVYRATLASFGTLPRFNQFFVDSARIGRNVVVNQGAWETQLETNKVAFYKGWVQQPNFLSAFPNSMTAADFVDKLDQNAGGVLSATERTSLINTLGATPSDTTKRASVLRSLVEDNDFKTKEVNRAFVLMQYFGYLRRNPDDPPDNNLDGLNFWLTKLNQFNGNFVEAEMVKAFIVSGEYRQRFGP